MTISNEEIFEKVTGYLQRNYPDARDVSMPYCSLYTGSLIKQRYFRVQLNYRRASDTHVYTSAVFQVNPDMVISSLYQPEEAKRIIRNSGGEYVYHEN